MIQISKALSCSAAIALAAIANPPASAQVPAAGASADRFIVLGSQGGPIPDPERSQPANVLTVGRDAFLVDVGDGTAEQLTKAGIRIPQVKAIVISHLHFDHTGGLAAILGLRYQTEVYQKLPIYGPPGTRALVDGIIRSMQPAADAGYGLPGKPVIPPGDTVEVIELGDGSQFKMGEVAVTAGQNTHYSFPAGSEKDKAFKSLSFRFDLPGRSIVYTGDTGPSEAVEKLATGADLLVAEMIDVDRTVAAVYRNTPGMSEQARKGLFEHLSTHHLTPAQVGTLAAKAGVRSVVVTHLVAPGASAGALLGYEQTIDSAFKGAVVIARDLDSF